MSKENNQLALFEMKEWWEDDWEGMPEYKQNDNMPWKTVYIHFACREDMEAFSKLVRQKIAFTTPFIWYPKVERFKAKNYRYIDDES